MSKIILENKILHIEIAPMDKYLSPVTIKFYQQMQSHKLRRKVTDNTK